MKAQSLTAALLALLPAVTALPASIPSLLKRTTGTTHVTQAIAQDFADPALFQSGNTWYAFASNNHKSIGNASAVGSGGLINTQVATSSDFKTWTVTGKDALPSPGSWASTTNSGGQGAAVWAPSVTQNNNGQYVLHYSAATASNPLLHCIGAAYASTPQGPYTAVASTIACPASQGGAIDSQVFKDVDGTFYVVYKIDGNSIGHGGSCGNSVAPIVPTPIMLQKLQGDAMTPTGSPIQLLDRGTADGPLIEAPALTRDAAGNYILFFSSNCFSGSLYDVSYAWSKSISGPYTKYGPMLVTGTDGLFSPGGLSVAADGVHAIFHQGNVGPANSWARSAWTQQLSFNDASHIVNS